MATALRRGSQDPEHADRSERRGANGRRHHARRARIPGVDCGVGTARDRAGYITRRQLPSPHRENEGGRRRRAGAAGPRVDQRRVQQPERRSARRARDPSLRSAGERQSAHAARVAGDGRLRAARRVCERGESASGAQRGAAPRTGDPLGDRRRPRADLPAGPHRKRHALSGGRHRRRADGGLADAVVPVAVAEASARADDRHRRRHPDVHSGGGNADRRAVRSRTRAPGIQRRSQRQPARQQHPVGHRRVEGCEPNAGHGGSGHRSRARRRRRPARQEPHSNERGSAGLSHQRCVHVPRQSAGGEVRPGGGERVLRALHRGSACGTGHSVCCRDQLRSDHQLWFQRAVQGDRAAAVRTGEGARHRIPDRDARLLRGDGDPGAARPGLHRFRHYKGPARRHRERDHGRAVLREHGSGRRDDAVCRRFPERRPRGRGRRRRRPRPLPRPRAGSRSIRTLLAGSGECARYRREDCRGQQAPGNLAGRAAETCGSRPERADGSAADAFDRRRGDDRQLADRVPSDQRVRVPCRAACQHRCLQPDCLLGCAAYA